MLAGAYNSNKIHWNYCLNCNAIKLLGNSDLHCWLFKRAFWLHGSNNKVTSQSPDLMWINAALRKRAEGWLAAVLCCQKPDTAFTGSRLDCTLAAWPQRSNSGVNSTRTPWRNSLIVTSYQGQCPNSTTCYLCLRMFWHAIIPAFPSRKKNK